MSSCLSGGGRGYELELGMLKSSPTSTQTSNGSSSPSSTVSESSDSPIFICTRKPRTQRKRPNQKYNEAAALLSTAYPKIFSPKTLRAPLKFSYSTDDTSFFDESSDLLLPFPAIDKSEFLLHHDHVQENGRLSFQTESKSSPLSERPCQSPGETEIQSNPIEFFDGYQEEFDADSILNEEMEEGIVDTIMGNVCTDAADNANGEPGSTGTGSGFCGKFDCSFGFGNGVGMNALRKVNGLNNWWDFHFPTVDVLEISSKFNKSPLTNSAEKKKKKKKNAEKPPKPEEEPKGVSGSIEADPSTAGPDPRLKPELLLKLNYDGILNAWSGRGSPFSDESSRPETLENDDVSVRLAQIDLFPEARGVREAIVQRYKEKRQTRLFSKKIRYQVRKDNADQRPRMKGRFVRQPSSSSNSRKR